MTVNTDPRVGVVRIFIRDSSKTAGTGFILTRDGLIATCAHVIIGAGSGPGQSVWLAFASCPDDRVQATVEEIGWREQEDIAILRLVGELPEGAEPLPLGYAKDCIQGTSFKSYGYPQITPHNEGPFEGTISGLVFPGCVLKINSTDILPGASGSPVVDSNTGWVVGIVKGFPTWKDNTSGRITAGGEFVRGEAINYAIPTEILLDIWPELDANILNPLADYRSPGIFTMQEYISALKKEFSVLNLPGIPGVPGGIQPEFEEIYVTQRLHTYQHTGAYIEFLTQKSLLVRDTAGSGKSTLLNRVLLDKCKDYSGNVSIIPIWLKAKDIDFKLNTPFIDYLIEVVAQQKGLSRDLQQQLYKASTEGKLSVLIDGLDEVPHDNRLNIARALGDASIQRHNNQIILASRPMGNIGINFPNAELERFDLFSASFLVDKWKGYFDQQGILNRDNNGDKLKALENALNDAFNDSGAISEILQTPLYLTYLIFNTISPEEDEQESSLLIKNETSLIKRTIEYVIPYWEEMKNGRILGQGFLPSKYVALKILWLTGFLLKKYPFSSKTDILFRLQDESRAFFEGLSSATLESGFNYWQECNVFHIKDINEAVSFWHAEIGEFCAAKYLCTEHGKKTVLSDKEMWETIRTDPDWANVKKFYIDLCE